MLCVNDRMVYREGLLVGSWGQERLYLCPCYLKQTVVVDPLVLYEMVTTFRNN